MNSSDLYSDFKLTIDNCDAEPIHRPIAIQGHGYMLVFNQKDPTYVYSVSDGVAELLQVSVATFWDTPAQEWLPESLAKVHAEIASPAPWHLVEPVPVEIQGSSYNLIRHTYQGKYFVEIESRVNSKADIPSSLGTIGYVSEFIRQQDTEVELFQATAQQLKQYIGYDRVMVYQFDQDYNGHVVGEAKEDHLEPFLDLHYPSTDIPEVARKLYLLNRSRIIADINLSNKWLRFNPAAKEPVSYLDLTYTQLRAISPIHIEYLGNMGVGATLVLGIIIENKLWGLISCHHYSAYFISYEVRKTAEVITGAFARRYLEVTKENQKQLSRSYVEHEIDFLSGITIDNGIDIQLVDKQTTLQQLCDADGAAVLSSSSGIYRIGIAPTEKVLIQIRDWLLEENHSGVFVSDDLFSQVPDTVEITESFCGMLAISLTEPDPTLVFWFRKSQIQETYWGGNPNEAYHVESMDDEEGIRLSPRKSFKKWKEKIRTRSRPWREYEIDMAHRVRESLLKKQIQRKSTQTQQLKQELERLTYITSHDLQEPLTTMTNYLGLLSEELGDQYSDNVKFFTERTNWAAERMKSMIKDLMDYSRVGTIIEQSWVHLPTVWQEVMAQMEAKIRESQVSFTVDPLPWVRGHRVDLELLLYHLVSNAVKFRAADANPHIHVRAQRQGQDWVFSVEDNGIGIEEKYFEKIFLIFQRLHREEEYEGNGIGLAICKKILNTYDGEIWVTSTIGEGSTFWFKMNASNVKTDE